MPIFWPTPTAVEWKGRGPNSNQQGLAEMVKKYPTPELTLLPADTLASPLVTPGSEMARQMTVTSGQKLKGSWLPSGPVGVFLRMFLDTSQWASTKCFLTWKAKATPQRRLLYQLAPSTPRTEETEFGLLPTPTEAAGTGGQTSRSGDRKDELLLGGVARAMDAGLWPTPTAQEAGIGPKSMENLDSGTTQMTIGRWVAYQDHIAKKLIPTPTVSSGAQTKENPTQGQTGGTTLWGYARAMDAGLWATMTVTTAEHPGRVKLKPGQQDCLSMQVNRAMWPAAAAQDAANNAGPSQYDRNSLPLNAVAGGSLNPQWVEWLMGYPAGWTDCED